MGEGKGHRSEAGGQTTDDRDQRSEVRVSDYDFNDLP